MIEMMMHSPDFDSSSEGEGELRRPAAQSGPGLPLALPGRPQHRPEPESSLFNLPTLGHPVLVRDSVQVPPQAAACLQAPRVA